MAGRALVHEQHGISLPHGIRFLHAMKKFSSIGKLRMKSFFHLFANFKRALLDAGPDRGMNIFRARAEFQPHDANAFFHDALHCPAPSGMKRAHGFLFCIDQQNREAVCGEDADRHAAKIGDQAVANKWALFKQIMLE